MKNQFAARVQVFGRLFVKQICEWKSEPTVAGFEIEFTHPLLVCLLRFFAWAAAQMAC